jgi:hypothetical protein
MSGIIIMAVCSSCILMGGQSVSCVDIRKASPISYMDYPIP